MKNKVILSLALVSFITCASVGYANEAGHSGNSGADHQTAQKSSTTTPSNSNPTVVPTQKTSHGQSKQGSSEETGNACMSCGG